MKLKEININHYRSFGENAHLKFDSHVMALVGLNGIGKSNVLEAISRMEFFNDGCDKVILPGAVNKNTRGNPSLRLLVEFSEDELRALGEKLDCTLQSKTAEYIFEYKDGRTRLRFSGTFLEAMEAQQWFHEIRKDITALALTIKQKRLFQNHGEYKVFCEAIADCSQYFIPRLKGSLAWMASNVGNHFQEHEHGQTAANLIKRFSSGMEHCYKVFREFSPTIHFFRDAAELSDHYDVDGIITHGQDHDGNRMIALQRFLAAIGSTREELLRAFQEADTSVRYDLQDRIHHSTGSLMEDFNHTFMQNQAGIRLNIKFDGNNLRFTVSNNSIPGSTLWSEASAGVRWYLNAFFELHKAIQSPNAFILIDEPAIHLHVNAQKEVLHFLYEMAEKTMCLIYTTHSPFMIDTNKLGDIRAIVKEGKTSNIRTLTGLSETTCKKDVLAPICHALGYDISANLSPNPKKTNLIVEGITDACYIGAMAGVLLPDEAKRPYILPGQGADSTSHIVPIMLGWGLNYKVVLDHDMAGIKTKIKMTKDFGEEVADRICFVSERENETIENLVSKDDYVLVCGAEYDAHDYKKDKRDKAYKFAGMVRSGELVPDAETRQNFLDLFVRLGLVASPVPVHATDNPAQETPP